MKFNVCQRRRSHTVTVIHAGSQDPAQTMALYLDNDTGRVCYPVEIVSAAPCMSIKLESDISSSCVFPPSVPENMVDGLIGYLGMFHETVAAARRFIREERERFQKGCDESSLPGHGKDK